MLNVAEAGRRAGRDPETIRRWIRSGKLRARKVGNKHMVDEADLAAAVEEPRSVGVPPELERFESGEPQPDWVKLIHRSRSSH